MADATLREFLVQIGYQTDKASEGRFLEGLSRATTKAIELGAAVAATATAVVAGVSKMADSMERLYFASQRTGAAVQSIQALGFAASQVGSTADAAKDSLESLGRFMRSSPGAGGFLANMGLRPDQIHDASAAMEGLSQKFRQMPYYRALAYSSFLGIDENTMRAMMSGEMEQFSAQYHKMARAAGLDSQKAAADAHGFMVQLRTLGAAVDILAQKVSASLTKKMGQDIGKLTDFLVAHFQEISRAIEGAARIILGFADGIARLLIRAVELDERTGGLISTIALLGIAFKALSMGLLTSPLGAFLAILTGILLIFDDFRAYQEGGKHLIDWDKFLPKIEAIWAKFEAIGKWFKDATGLSVFQGALVGLLAYFTATWVIKILAGVASLGSAFVGLATTIGGLSVALAPFLATLVTIVGLLDIIKRGPTGNIPGNERKYFEEHGIPVPPGMTPGAPNPNGPKVQGSGFAGDVVNFFTGRGWSLAQAAGIAANLRAESNFDPTRTGDSGNAHGIAQWHADRQAAIEAHFGKKLADMTFQEQLAAVDWELQEGPERAAGAALRMTQTPEAAGAIVSAQYERPRDSAGEVMARAHGAREIYAGMDNTRVAPPGGAGDVTINQNTHITVNGAFDAHATAAAAGREQDRVNADLLRNTKGAVR